MILLDFWLISMDNAVSVVTKDWYRRYDRRRATAHCGWALDASGRRQHVQA